MVLRLNNLLCLCFKKSNKLLLRLSISLELFFDITAFDIILD